MKQALKVKLLTPVFKINKTCAIHLVGLKNQTKKQIFSYSYDNIQQIMKNITQFIKFKDNKYIDNAIVEFCLLQNNLDISHEVGAISNGLFSDLLPILSELKLNLQSFTDDTSITKESSASTDESLQ